MTLIELARRLRPYIEKAVQSLTDADALEAVQLYPAWKVGESYEPERRVRWAGKLWRVLQAHTSQASYPILTTISMWWAYAAAKPRRPASR